MGDTDPAAPGQTVPTAEASTEGAQSQEAASAQPAPATREDIEALRAEVQKAGKAAYDAARRAENKADNARRIVESKTAELEGAYEQLVTQNLSEPDARAWKAERELKRVQETHNAPDVQYERAAAEFQSSAATYMAAEGVNEADISESFQQYAKNAKTPAEWDIALIRAVADHHKTVAKQAKDEAKTAGDRAREDERAKLRNEKRSNSGPIDRSSPSAGGGKSPAEMNPEEFDAHLQRLGARPLSSR